MLKLVAAHFKMPSGDGYCLNLKGLVKYQPETLVPVNSWSDCFELASCLPDFDDRDPFRVYQYSQLIKLRTLNLIWVGASSWVFEE
jgi:hypothetical protein